MTKIQCELCNRVDTLQIINKGRYLRVRHYTNGNWVYHRNSETWVNSELSKQNLSVNQLVARLMTSKDDVLTRSLTSKIENLNSSSNNENTRAGRLVWLGHWLYEPKVAGSSPARPIFTQFIWLFAA